jgi:hypothetical protein
MHREDFLFKARDHFANASADGLPINSRQQSQSSLANSLWASEEIPHILWFSNPLYLFQMKPKLVPTPPHINSVHTCPLYFFKIHFTIIQPPNPRSYN